jgi:hypothetical protein
LAPTFSRYIGVMKCSSMAMVFIAGIRDSGYGMKDKDSISHLASRISDLVSGAVPGRLISGIMIAWR